MKSAFLLLAGGILFTGVSVASFMAGAMLMCAINRDEKKAEQHKESEV